MVEVEPSLLRPPPPKEEKVVVPKSKYITVSIAIYMY